MTLVVSPDQMPDWMRKKANIYREIDNQLIRGLESPGEGLTLEQLQALVEHKNSFEERAAASPVPAQSILARLYESETITVGATDGTETLAEAKDVFDGYIDPDFKNWKTNKEGQATGPTLVNVYEMHRRDATFAGMFGSLADDVRKIVFPQGQIKRFCKDHRAKLRTDGYATFFLFEVELKTGPEVFVAVVIVVGRELWAYVHRFDYSYVWLAGHRFRLVVPELASL